MTIKQLESKAEIILGLFACAFFGAIVAAVQSGQLPVTWPQWQHVMGGGLTAGLMAVYGWIKMKSPLAPASIDTATLGKVLGSEGAAQLSTIVDMVKPLPETAKVEVVEQGPEVKP